MIEVLFLCVGLSLFNHFVIIPTFDKVKNEGIISMVRHVPNFITSLNLLSGCIALVFAFEGQLVYTSIFIGLGAFFDFADGFAARLLNVKSKIGKELDSLADVVTFGVAPGVIIFQLIHQNIVAPQLFLGNISVFPFVGFLIPVFSALRLAKFNTDDRQEHVFYGLPTPASALFIGALPLILAQQSTPIGGSISLVHEIIENFYVLIAITILISGLMVSELKLFSLKFNSYSWYNNRIRYIFLGLCLLMLIALHFIALPLSILLYVFMSLILNKSFSF